jgi:integrase
VQGKTFKEVYELFYERKYGENAPKKLAQKTKSCDIASFKHCEELHDRIFTTITHNELQALINDCQYGTVVKKKIISLLHQMYKYARIYDITDKDNSEGLATSENNSKHGIPFTESDIKVLWKHKDDEMVEMLLIMIYSGFRIAEYETIEVNFDKMYFKGGVKTANSKNRIVPIHSAIQPLVRSRMKKRKKMMNKTVDGFRKKMYRKLEELGIEKHTPHDCRHTFSALCEHFKMPEADRKRLLGHSLGSDITNSVYGHRTLEELRESIEMIKVDVCD